MAALQQPPPGALESQNDELWKAALEKFKTEDSELYERLQSITRKDKDPATQNDVLQVQQFGAVLAQKRCVMEDQQWVIHWGRKAIKIGPQFDKIIKLVKLVKPIGDAVAGLDPIHAGIPWACVSMLLPVSRSDSH